MKTLTCSLQLSGQVRVLAAQARLQHRRTGLTSPLHGEGLFTQAGQSFFPHPGPCPNQSKLVSASC